MIEGAHPVEIIVVAIVVLFILGAGAYAIWLLWLLHSEGGSSFGGGAMVYPQPPPPPSPPPPPPPPAPERVFGLEVWLAQVMPKEADVATASAVVKAWSAEGYHVEGPLSVASVAYKAIRDHLTKPKTKTVEVKAWALINEHTGETRWISAHEEAARHEARVQNYRLVELTGKATVST